MAVTIPLLPFTLLLPLDVFTTSTATAFAPGCTLEPPGELEKMLWPRPAMEILLPTYLVWAGAGLRLLEAPWTVLMASRG